MRRIYVFMMILAMSAFIYPSCNSSRAVKGAVIGAGAGAAAGAVLSKKNKAAAILFGAAIGGVAGGAIGHYMDKQAEKIAQDLEGAKVERVGEGILITFDSGLLFDHDSYALKSQTKQNLEELAVTLNKYPDTDILVLGHTDATGTDEYNQGLSERRAKSVDTYLVMQDVASARTSAEGYGETDPVADNTTDVGRQENRRVEVVVIANKKLERAAKRGELAE